MFAISRISGALFVLMLMSVAPVRAQDDDTLVPVNPAPAEVSCCCVSPPDGTTIACVSPGKEGWEQEMDSGLSCADYKACEK